jgi:hypothetical protein
MSSIDYFVRPYEGRSDEEAPATSKKMVASAI